MTEKNYLTTTSYNYYLHLALVKSLESSHIRLFRCMHVSGGLGSEAALHCNYVRLEWSGESFASA